MKYEMHPNVDETGWYTLAHPECVQAITAEPDADGTNQFVTFALADGTRISFVIPVTVLGLVAGLLFEIYLVRSTPELAHRDVRQKIEDWVRQRERTDLDEAGWNALSRAAPVFALSERASVDKKTFFVGFCLKNSTGIYLGFQRPMLDEAATLFRSLSPEMDPPRHPRLY